MSNSLKVLSVPAKGIHRATVFFLHGSGDTGPGAHEWIRSLLGRDLQVNFTKVVFPTAPLQPYTPAGGDVRNVWHDRIKIAQSSPERLGSIDATCKLVTSLIDEEVKNGIPKEKIVIGGFSMGGGLAYHLGYRFHQDVAGVFALSSFLSYDSEVLKVLKSSDGRLPPLFCCHGNSDPLVRFEWGLHTYEDLKALGVEGEFHSYPNLHHELGYEELKILETWISTVTMLT